MIRRLEREYPVLHEAYELWNGARSDRWLFEATVMANAPVEEASDYLHMPIEVLELYEQLFFDVRGYLLHRGHVIANVLLPSGRSLHPQDQDFFWKLLAYEGGWNVVQQMWEIDAMDDAPA